MYVSGKGVIAIFAEGAVIAQEEFDHLYPQCLEEMKDPSFRGIYFLVSIWENAGAAPYKITSSWCVIRLYLSSLNLQIYQMGRDCFELSSRASWTEDWGEGERSVAHQYKLS